MRPIGLLAVLLCTSCATRHPTAAAPVLKSTASYLDLRPGIRLNIEKAYYAGGSDGRGLNGFIGTQLATFGVQQNGSLRLLDLQNKPFREGLASQIPADQLLPAFMRNKRSYRFFYAVPFARASRPTASVLIGAKSAREIEDLSKRLAVSPDEVCRPQSTLCTVFPEGSTVSISMEIFVNGDQKVVLWGSVLGSLAQGRSAATLDRRGENHPQQIRLEGDTLRMPLQPGDRISF